MIISTGDYGGNEELRKTIFRNFGKRDIISILGKKKASKLLRKDYEDGARIINQLGKLRIETRSINGNWDFAGMKYYKATLSSKLKNYPRIMKDNNITFMDHRIRNIKGLKTYTHGGLMLASIFHTKDSGFEDKNRKYYFKWHKKQEYELFSRKSKNLDMMIAHCPPQGYFDKVNYNGKNPMNGKHVGFKPYTKYIKKYQPKLFICGHMHEHQGIKKLGKTTIISHGAAYLGRGAIIEIENIKKDNKSKAAPKIRIRLIKS
jgi:Icc-related predicted phosphoesterase